MNRMFPMAVAACAGMVVLRASPAMAHAVCGSRIFPVTLTLDDPGVSDEVTLPQIVYQRSGADGGPGPSHDTSFQFEYDKRITENFGIGIDDDWSVNQTDHAKTETGWDDISVTAKYAACVTEDHEFIVALGVEPGVRAQRARRISVRTSSAARRRRCISAREWGICRYRRCGRWR
ncbi:MAG: hypothetical protein WDN04_22710 [Rhodospirillales bacterium]